MIASRVIVALSLLSTCTGVAAAQLDTTFTYQGRLMDAGSPANGNFDVKFRLYDVAVGGTPLVIEFYYPALLINEGLITASNLNFGSSTFDGTDRYLEVEVDGNVLVPRQRINPTPYAIQTRGIHVNSQKSVGIGTTAPADDLHVFGDNATLRLQDDDEPASYTRLSDDVADRFHIAKYRNFGQSFIDLDPIPLDGSSRSWLRFFRNVDTTGAKQAFFYRGNNTTEISASIGVDGADSWIGAHGGRLAVGHTAPLYPLHVKNASSGNTSIFGENDRTAGIAVRGSATSASGTATGVQGTSTSRTGTGVSGYVSDTTGPNIGVKGYSLGSAGIGIHGEVNAQGSTTGVFGLVNSTTGRGVSGRANAFFGECYGVHGETNSTEGFGVFGIATTTTGVNYGVYGESKSSSGYDFYAGGVGVDYGATSSIRWKDNVENIDNPLGKISQLRGVYFDWDETHGGKHDVGMIAEEVGKILPEIVIYEENGYDAIGMDYSKITPLLVEATNALRAEKDAQIKQLKTDTARLQSENESLRARLDRLEQVLDLKADGLRVDE